MDFRLEDTDDLDIDHHGDSGSPTRANAPAAGSSLFSGDDDDFRGSGLYSGDDGKKFGADYPGAPPSRRVAPLPQRPAPGGRRSGSSGLFSGDDHEGYVDSGIDSAGLAPRRAPAPPPQPRSQAPSSLLSGSSGLFGGNEDDDDFGGNSANTKPSRRGGLPPPSSRSLPPVQPPAAPSNRSGSGGLFGDDDGSSDESGFGLDAETDYGEGVSDAGRRRPPAPPPVGKFTNPSVSLDANDSNIADMLGPQTNGGAPARTGSVRTVTQPLRGDSPGGYRLDAEDSLQELLRESSLQEQPAPPPPPSSRPPRPGGPPSNRRISFQEPVVAPPRSPPPPAPPPRPEGGSFGDSVSGDSSYGLERDANRSVPPPPVRRDTPSDDLVSGDDYGEVTFEERVPSPTARVPGSGSSFKRISAPGSAGYNSIKDPLDSPVARGGRPLRGIPPRRQVGESSDFNYDEDDEYSDEFVEDDGTYGNRGVGSDRRRGGSAAFRRVPAPDPRGSPPRRPAAPSPPGNDDDVYGNDFSDDEDTFADDRDWDGEIRFSAGGAGRGRDIAASALRPGSARQPRSRGPHATGGTRLRATSVLPPRERQAAMIEDMMSRHPRTWDAREVATWVEFIGLGQYRTKFVHNAVDGGLLLSLGEAELARDLRILPLGHRRALLAAIGQLRETAEAMETQRGTGAGGQPKGEAARVAELRRRAAEQGPSRRPSSAGARVIPPEPFLGPAAGKMTVYEQRAKLLFHLDRAKHRAAQHAAIIDQLANNKALTEAQVAELRGKVKDLEAKHKDEFSPSRRRGMTAPVAASFPGSGHRGGGAAALDAAEYGADATVPWLPVGCGTRTALSHPERFARTGEDQEVDLTFRPRVGRIEEVPAGAVRDIVAKALGSRTPFWQRMEFEFNKMRREREAREEARRKRRERMGVARRGGGGEDEDEEQARSKHWNNYWVPNSNKNLSYHKNYKRGSENQELKKDQSFAKDKARLSRWFRKFVTDDESTDGDVALERLVNRMIRALAKTKAQMDVEVGDTFDKRIRKYFKDRNYKFETHTSSTVKVRARGVPQPPPDRPDTTMYDFEQVEQYYPDYLKKKIQNAGDGEGGDGWDDGGGDAPNMVPKRTIWKRLVAMYYMDRQNKIGAAIAMIKMSQFVQRHGARRPPERQENGKKEVWVPSSAAGALHQLNGLERTFNTRGQENISLHAKRKKALAPPEPVTQRMLEVQQAELEAKAEAMFAPMGWPHSSGDPSLGPPLEPLLLPSHGGGLEAEGDGEGGGGRQPWSPPLDFFGALDELLDRALELRHRHEEWLDSWARARERGYGEEDLSPEAPRSEDLDWRSDDPLMTMQIRAMERKRQEWLLAWEQARRRRERQADRMRSQGYLEEDIEHRLGPQQEASNVEYAVQNHLFQNIELLSRLKDTVLQRFKRDLKGTEKMVTVSRALRTQMFLDETRAREQRREESLRSVYESLRLGSRRVVTPEEVASIMARMEEHAAGREARRQKLVEEKMAEEEASLTPWYLRPRTTSRPPSQPTSRTTSPRGRHSAQSPPQPSEGARGRSTTPQRPSSAGRTRGTSGGRGATAAGGPLEGEGSSRSKYVFGSSTPKSMWGPIGPVRQQSTRRAGTSLLDSPGLGMGLQGGYSVRSLDYHQQQPTWQRPSTPTRPSGGDGGGAAAAAPGSAARRPAPPQRPQSALAPSASTSQPSGGGGTAAAAARRPTSAAPSSSARGSVGGGHAGSSSGGAAGARPETAAPPSPRSRGPPVSPGRGRSPAPGPPASPRRNMLRVGFAAPQSPTRSSAGSSLPNRSRAGPARRGLMDGDTSGTPSPERGPPRPNAGAAAAAAALQRRRGLADSDSSPSPQPRGPPASKPGSLPAALTTMSDAGPGAGASSSRRSSAAGGSAGPGPAAARATAAAAGGGVGAGSPPPPVRQASSQSRLAHPPPGLSQQAGSSLGLAMGGGRVAAAAASAGGSASGSASRPPPGRASRTGSTADRVSATGSTGGAPGAGGSASGSRRPSTPPPAAGAALIQQESFGASESSSTSIAAIGRAGVSGRGAASGRSAPQKSPLSRSPVASPPGASPKETPSPSHSPPSASPQPRSPPVPSSVASLPLHSPPAASPPSKSPPAASPRDGSAAPSPQASQLRVLSAAAVEAEATASSGGVGHSDDYALDEYELDAEEGAELDYGDEGDAELNGANADSL